MKLLTCISFLVSYSIVMFFILKFSLDFRSLHVRRSHGSVLNRIDHITSNSIAGVSLTLSLGINEKYNWNYTGEFHKNYFQFAPALNIAEFNCYMNLITTFKDACETFSITYMLGAGSVLGVYWFHGFIPWDDDIDCIVNTSQKHILKKALGNRSGYTLLTSDQREWRFYSNNFGVATGYEWKWPFIDIYLFTENETHLYDLAFKKPIIFNLRSDILPLEKGIFENMVLPVPHKMEAYLKRMYNVSQLCMSRWWIHMKERYSKFKPARIPCHKLYGVYPFVHRLQIDNNSFEELRQGENVLYRVEGPGMKLTKP